MVPVSKPRQPARRVAAARPPRVAYLGPAGTYTHSAVLLKFGDTVDVLPQVSIEDVFQAVQEGAADYGVVPVENSSEGAVNSTLDRLMSTSPPICGEVELRVHHNLMGRMQDLASVKRVCAHPQALAQCREWLQGHLP